MAKRNLTLAIISLTLIVALILFISEVTARDSTRSQEEGYEISTYSSGNSDYMCEQDLVIQNIYPDQSPIQGEPKLPVPPVDDKPSCRHYSFDFCREFKKLNPNLNCQIQLFGEGEYRHASNSYEFLDSVGERWVCFIEPQPIQVPGGLKYEKNCVKASTIVEYGGLDKWIKEKICKEYYKFPKHKCNSGDTKYYQICAQQYGQACNFNQLGKEILCILNFGGSEEFGPFNINKLKCKCSISGVGQDVDGIKRCSWQTP